MKLDPTSALGRAAQLLRLSGPAGPAPEVAESGDALVCPATGRRAVVRNGIIDLLGTRFEPNLGQRLLDTAPSAWFYDLIRPRLAPLVGMPTFDSEVASVVERLGLEPGSTVLDIACGQGNFTLELARFVGPGGLVIGLDIAGAMLKRAVQHLRESGLSNVVLLRGDALDLPFADACLSHINCSGGLHQFPDLKRALAEMARANRPAGRMTISGFASPTNDSNVGFRRWVQGGDVNFVPMDELEADMQSAGYEQIGGDMPGRWVGYRWGTRNHTRV
ncbi:MAG: methyltransferase domain-containing protein [Myxococcota bacterium]